MTAHNQQARQHTENAAAKIAFWAVPNVDPFDARRAPLRLVPPAEQNPDYRRHLRLVDDAAREVDGYAVAERQDEVVRFARRRGPSGGAA